MFEGRKVWVYLRVSTDAQDVANQRKGIANRGWFGEEVEDSVTGSLPWAQRGIGELFRRFGRGDVLVVSESSRIGRDMVDVLTFVRACEALGVDIYDASTGVPISLEGDAKIITAVKAAISEYERANTKRRTKETYLRMKDEAERLGLKVRWGRPVGAKAKARKYDQQWSQIVKLLRADMSISEVCRLIKVSRPTFYSMAKEKGFCLRTLGYQSEIV
jgi:DNA invertase Pin-like site-specific DNA recombinase